MRRTLLALPLVLAACSSGDAAKPTDGPTGTASGAVTFHRDVRPILEANCSTCHVDGGATPFAIGWNASEWQNGAIPDWAKQANGEVQAGEMPPWKPAADCHPLASPRGLTDAQKQAIADWTAAGFPLGDEADYVPPDVELPPDPGPPELSMDTGADYVPSRDLPDDYRCFVLPATFDAETYVTSVDVVPGARALVHHALVYVIDEAGAAALQQADDAEPGPGYTCFGGPGGGAPQTLAGWVPGAIAPRMPDGAALVVPKGARLVLQIHYNTLNFTPDQTLPSDRSSVALWTYPAGQVPTSRVDVTPLADLRLDIAAGDANSVQERDFTVPATGKLIAVQAHMHKLGKDIEVSMPSAGADACLLHIPSWDFNWQQQYAFPTDRFVDVKQGDKLHLRCTYDNSKANQPVVNGVQQAPREVWWGESTLDEMCLAYIGVMTPFQAATDVCGGVDACKDACDPTDAGCFYDCASGAGEVCGNCLIDGIAQCAPAFCATTGLALKQCADGCTSAERCLAMDCQTQWQAFYGCMQPHLAAGECNDDLAACGVSY